MIENLVSAPHRVCKFVTLCALFTMMGFTSGRNLDLALSEEKMRMAEEGTLLYGSLSSGEKSHLFTTYMSQHNREVSQLNLRLHSTVYVCIVSAHLSVNSSDLKLKL